MENEADIAAFKDYHPPSEDDILSVADTSKSMSTSEQPLPVTPLSTSTLHHVTAASTVYVPISSSTQSIDKVTVLASPYARKLAAEKGIDLKVK